MSRDWITPEIIIAISSVSIALCALGISLWQGYLTRKHNKLTVNPYGVIQIDISAQSEQVGVHIRNQGVGPMILTSIKIRREDGCIDFADMSNVQESLGLQGEGFVFRICSGHVSVLPNEDIWIISTTKHLSNKDLISRLKTALNDSLIEITYESVYGEKYNSGLGVPRFIE